MQAQSMHRVGSCLICGHRNRVYRVSLFLQLIIVLSLVHSPLCAQQITVDAEVVDDKSSKPVPGATLKVYKDSEFVAVYSADEKGRFPIFRLKGLAVFKLHFTAPGYIVKVAEVDTRTNYSRDFSEMDYVQMQCSLFKSCENVNWDFLLNNSMIRFAWTEDGYMDYDLKFTRNMLKKLEVIRTQCDVPSLRESKLFPVTENRQERNTEIVQATEPETTRKKRRLRTVGPEVEKLSRALNLLSHP